MLATNAYSHESVMLNEVLDLLITDPQGTYVDGTFGRGGHSRAILNALGEQDRLFGIDRDPEAVAVGEALAQEDPRFTMVASRFDCLPQVEAQAGGKLSGILLDL